MAILPIMVCTLHLRGLIPHLTIVHRGTKATSTTISGLTTRRRRNLHRRMGDISTTTTTTKRTAPLGSSKDVC
nr:unnamed protein product [Digitaria exilis]CAB3483650.1 unnamed protein product [Digitaria exilis]